ncbi:60S ribosomal protein L31 [Candidatus Micrarchaeota archaeon]|nr:60S ribosomal protein L31 [Candidatus Micrarchaeota archaeon]
MAEERFEDKTQTKKDDAKMKGEEDLEKGKRQAPQAAKEEATAEKAPDEKKTEKASKAEEPKKAEKKFVLERKYTVNLSKAHSKPRFKQQNKALSLLQEFCKRHMKGAAVHVDVRLNNAIRKSAKPLKYVDVLLQKDEAGTVYAQLAENK